MNIRNTLEAVCVGAAYAGALPFAFVAGLWWHAWMLAAETVSGDADELPQPKRRAAVAYLDERRKKVRKC